MLIDQILFMIKSLYFSIMAVTISVVLILIILNVYNRKVNYYGKSLDILGLFVIFDLKDRFKFIFYTLKLMFFISFLFQIKNLELIHYALYLVLSFLSCILLIPDLYSLKTLINDIALTAGLFLVSALFSYRATMYLDNGFILVLLMILVFMGIYSIYHFLDEINHMLKVKEIKNEN